MILLWLLLAYFVGGVITYLICILKPIRDNPGLFEKCFSWVVLFFVPVCIFLSIVSGGKL